MSFKTNVASFSDHRYATRESNTLVKIYKNFKEKKSFKPDFGAEGKISSNNADVNRYKPYVLFASC